MIEDILREYEKLEVALPEWIKKYRKQNQEEYQIREKQNWLADKFIEYFKFNKEELEWSIAGSKDFALVVDGNEVFVIQRLPGSYSSRCYGGKTYDYLFTIFKNRKEIFSLRNFCDGASYDSHSFRIPMMDLYDVVVLGEKRKPPTAHVCGLQGFNSMLGDTCPAC